MEGLTLSPIMHHIVSASANLDEDPSSPILDASHNYDPCMKALHKPPAERKTEDIELIAESLKSFKHLMNSTSSSSDPERVFHDLSKKATYRRFAPSSIVFHKGDTDDRIFFVLQGTAVLFNEIAPEVFKVPSIIVPEEVKTEKSPDETQNRRSKLLLREMSLDDSSKALFQPKMTKKFVRQFTSVGDVTIPNRNNTSIRVVPTVHDLKKAINESYSADNAPEHDFSSHLDNTGRMAPPDSPTREEREAKRKIILYKLLLKADKEKPGKYVKDGQFLYQHKKRVSAGMHFGEVVSRNSKVRAATAVALEELHVISIRADDYLSALSHPVGNVNNNIRFLEPFFSDASYPKLLKLLDLFEECEYPQRHKIFEEDTPIDALYLIKEGEVQLLKSLDTSKYSIKDEKAVPSNIRKKCFIATLGKGEALGDEDFFFGDKRNYTGIVTSVKTVMLRLSKQVYNEISGVYRDLFDGLKKTAKAKMQYKKEHVKNITHQVVQSAQHIEGLKKAAAKLIKQPTIKITEGENPVVYMPGEQQSPLRQRSGSPINRMLSNTPTGDKSRIDTFADLANKTTTSPLKQSKRTFDFITKNPISTSPSYPKSLVQSPMRSPDLSPKNTMYDKKSSELHLLPKPVKTQQERPRSQIQVVRQPSRSGAGVTPFPEGSSLYKEALGHVRRRKPVSMKREHRGPMSNKHHDHKLYMGELEKSVQMFTKTGSRNDLSGNSGYVSVATSPGTKLQNDKNGGIIWDTMFSKEDEDTKLMAAALVREKVNLRMENDLIEKYRISKGYSVKNGSQKMTRMDQTSSQNPLPHVRSQELSLHHVKTSSSLLSIPRRQDSGSKYQETRSLLYKRNSQPKFDDMLATLEPESFDAEPVRTGFKPSKVLTMKIQFRATLNHKIKGKKFWEVK